MNGSHFLHLGFNTKKKKSKDSTNGSKYMLGNKSVVSVGVDDR